MTSIPSSHQESLGTNAPSRSGPTTSQHKESTKGSRELSERRESASTFRELLSGRSKTRDEPPAPRSEAPRDELSPLPILLGLCDPQLTLPRSRSPSQEQQALALTEAAGSGPTDVDRALALQTRDVQLASDGKDRYLLRFEVSSGELSGTRIALSSDGGVISAVVTPNAPEMSLRLEQALEAARQSLEARGIDVSGMEVRTGVNDQGGRDHDETSALDDGDLIAVGSQEARGRGLTRTPPVGELDYIV